MGEHNAKTPPNLKSALLWMAGGLGAVAASVLVFIGWIPTPLRMRAAVRLFVLGALMAGVSTAMFFALRKSKL
jgi:hypothetical protein